MQSLVHDWCVFRACSMVKNPACPHMIRSASTAEYALYRQYIVRALSTLKFLDSQRVSHQERAGAQQRKAFEP